MNEIEIEKSLPKINVRLDQIERIQTTLLEQNMVLSNSLVPKLKEFQSRQGSILGRLERLEIMMK